MVEVIFQLIDSLGNPVSGVAELLPADPPYRVHGDSVVVPSPVIVQLGVQKKVSLVPGSYQITLGCEGASRLCGNLTVPEEGGPYLLSQIVDFPLTTP